MNGSDAIPVSEKLSRAFDEGPSEDDIVFRVHPPVDSDGLQSSLDLFRAFHNTETTSGFFGQKNASSVCGFEIWYENESLKFVFITPDESTNEQYRRQLSGHFTGVSLDDYVDTDEKFISVDEGEHVATTRLSLRKHYFEPIGNPISGDGEVEHDPYQTILNEADTKDETKMVIQFLYKPALSGWTRLRWENCNQYADRLEEDGVTNIHRFGTYRDVIDNPQARQTGASNIRGRANTLGYHVEARIMVAHPDKSTAEKQLNAVVNPFNTTYLSPTEQTLVPEPPSNTPKFLVNMIRREPTRLDLPSGFRGFLSAKWSGVSNRMVMTIPEFAGLVHIPSDGDISVDGVDWADAPVQGTLPPNAEKFTPILPSEVKDALSEAELREVAEHEPDLLHEFEELITEEHTRIPSAETLLKNLGIYDKLETEPDSSVDSDADDSAGVADEVMSQ